MSGWQEKQRLAWQSSTFFPAILIQILRLSCEMGLTKSDLLLTPKDGTVVGDDPITRGILNLIIERPGAAGAKP